MANLLLFIIVILLILKSIKDFKRSNTDLYGIRRNRRIVSKFYIYKGGLKWNQKEK